MVPFTCEICNGQASDRLICCSLGCGSFVHIKCLEKPGDYVCSNCSIKAPDSRCKTTVLSRISELMNIILSQSQDIADLKAELSACKSELTVTRKEIVDLKSKIPAGSVFEFGGHSSRSAVSVPKKASAPGISSSTLTPPAVVIMAVPARIRLNEGELKPLIGSLW